MDWAETAARRDKRHLSFGIWCDLYERFYGRYRHNTIDDVSQATHILWPHVTLKYSAVYSWHNDRRITWTRIISFPLYQINDNITMTMAMTVKKNVKVVQSKQSFMWMTYKWQQWKRNTVMSQLWQRGQKSYMIHIFVEQGCKVQCGMQFRKHPRIKKKMTVDDSRRYYKTWKWSKQRKPFNLWFFFLEAYGTYSHSVCLMV